MNITGLTIAQLAEQLKNEDNPDALKAVVTELGTDLKQTKEVLLIIFDMLGLVKDGQFLEKIKPSTISKALGSITAEMLNPFASKDAMAKRFAFLATLPPIINKYKNL